MQNNLGKQAAHMGYSFRQLPKFLTFNLCRFDYNWNTQRRSKLNGRFDFPLVLDMDAYCEQQVEQRIRQEEEERTARAAHYKALREQAQLKVEHEAAANTSPSSSDVDLSQGESLFTLEPTATIEVPSAAASTSTDSTATSETTTTTTNTAAAVAAVASDAPISKRQRRKNQHQQQQQNANNNKKQKQQKQQKAASKNSQKQQRHDNDDDDDTPASDSTKSTDPVALWQMPVNTDSTNLYDLFSIGIHSGGAYGGHYYAYIRDTYVQDYESVSQ
jgi:ubiquitin carboxyl-terminal hydrolase 47